MNNKKINDLFASPINVNRVDDGKLAPKILSQRQLVAQITTLSDQNTPIMTSVADLPVAAAMPSSNKVVRASHQILVNQSITGAASGGQNRFNPMQNSITSPQSQTGRIQGSSFVKYYAPGRKQSQFKQSPMRRVTTMSTDSPALTRKSMIFQQTP